MIYSVRSSKTLEELDSSLRAATQQNEFGILNTLDLKETLSKKGITLDRECRVYDVCNPQRASEGLRKDMSISVVLPCRISIFDDGAERVLATLGPLDLMRATGLQGLDELASEIDEKMRAIVDQAA